LVVVVLVASMLLDNGLDGLVRRRNQIDMQLTGGASS
jgi:hypothetical protein